MPGYLFIDEDDVVVKPVERIQYKLSNNCEFRCIPSQISNSCCCKDRLERNYKRVDELRELLKPNENKVVSFGKFKGVGWIHMFNGSKVSSWSEWYINNCSNKNDFYDFLLLLKEYEELQSEIVRIRNPNYD